MLLFPHAKINIGLFVTRRREDGYHILQTLFYPIDWRDGLEILPQSETLAPNCISTLDNRIHWHQTGITVDCDPEQNLCVKAYRLLQNRFPDLPSVDMFLEKQIPFGAGLGGGSSDGAHALLMLREMFKLEVSDADLESMAARLGADCAFFCRCGNRYNTAGNGGKMIAQYCEGIGHELVPHSLSLQGKYIVIVKPPFGVSTREAYSGVHPNIPAVSLDRLLKRPLNEWKEFIHNDFEDSVFPLHPQLAEAKQILYDHGAVYASMSGSGSALFGIFDNEQSCCTTWFDDNYLARGHWALV
ncbi:MAG: 4-(cytidine 5'-diphospho)-2-C-methyl-D-erythritol kinase [Bacteroidales bacterium]|nr:4-(cytidine 5'-diphospho)-2-C-methyl-D-erythritol kinase [Bacteroidales bacterium]